MYNLWIHASRILELFSTYFLIAKFRFSQQFLKVKWLFLTVYKFDASKSWNIIYLKDFHGILWPPLVKILFIVIF